MNKSFCTVADRVTPPAEITKPQQGETIMNRTKRIIVAIAAFALAITLNTSNPAYGAEATATGLRDLHCESQSNPLGIDAAPPRLSWKLADARRGAHQNWK
jgi:hypothetical protein